MFITREKLLEKYGNVSWISPYSEIVAMYSDGFVELHEYHAREKCIGGSAWEVYHYPKVSNLIVHARREGARNIFVLKTGKTKLNLIPGIASAGVEEVRVDEQCKEVEITYSGLAGGGIAATVCRGMARGVKGIEIIERGGGGKIGKAKLFLPIKKKIVVGVDDTDNKEEGATWSLVNEIAFKLEKAGFGKYLNHTIVQLYPKAPNKTTNCVSVSATFAADNDFALIRGFEKLIGDATLSDETAIAVYRKVIVEEILKKYGNEVKKKIVDLNYAENVAKQSKVKLISITGNLGKIGALAAVSFENTPDQAVKLY